MAYDAWVSKAAVKGIAKHAFYRFLYAAEVPGGEVSAHQLSEARADLKTLNVGWAVEWRNVWTLYHPVLRYRRVSDYLEAVGFRFVNDRCLIDVGAGNPCPTGQHVWLFRYEPGHRG